MNRAMRRGSLLAVLLIVAVYEHTPHPVQVALVVAAVVAALCATAALVWSPDERHGTERRLASVEMPEGLTEAKPLTGPFLLYAGQSNSENIDVPMVYLEQIWSTALHESKSIKGFGRFRPSQNPIELGPAISWRANELREIIKAVTAENHSFTVELTNTDSILIHCDDAGVGPLESPTVNLFAVAERTVELHA
jgi:hypothetical protein